jgi:hypothetical protein
MSKDLQDRDNAHAFGDQQFHQTQKFPREHHKTQRTKAHTKWGKEFGENVAIQQRS